MEAHLTQMNTKEVKMLRHIRRFMKNLGSWYRVNPFKDVDKTLARLEELRKEHEKQANILGITIGTIKGTKVYQRRKQNGET